LSAAGHEFTGCDSGEDGLELIRKQQFNIVLLDLSMPGFCGMDVLNALEKIVIFTATNPSEEESSSLFKKGVHSILKKPLDVDMLMDHINKISS